MRFCITNRIAVSGKLQALSLRRRKPVKRPVGSRIHAELAAGIGMRILDGTYPAGTLLPNEAEQLKAKCVSLL